MASNGRSLTTYFPIFFVSKIFGLTFFSSSKLVFIYRLFILGLLIAIVIVSVPVMSFWTSAESGDLEAFLQFSKNSIAWINYFINYLITVYKNKKIISVFDSLAHLDLKIEDRRLRKLFYLQLIRIALNFAVICFYQFLAVHLTDERIKYSFSVPMYIFLDSLHIFGVLQFVESVVVMKEYFRSLNEKMSKMRSK